VLSVAPTEEGPDELRALKDLIVPPEEKRLLWPWLIGTALLLIALLVTIWILLRKRAPASVRELMRLTPAQRALKDLDKLLKSGLLYDGNFKQFYSDLADIARRYLGLRYHIMALEMTTTELLTKLKESKNSRRLAAAGILGSLLEVCDLAKFAKLHPLVEEGEDGIEISRNIVIKTRDDAAPSENATEASGD
jgi:hypothetical protein